MSQSDQLDHLDMYWLGRRSPFSASHPDLLLCRLSSACKLENISSD